jgi:hypothetical protein
MFIELYIYRLKQKMDLICFKLSYAYLKIKCNEKMLLPFLNIYGVSMSHTILI